MRISDWSSDVCSSDLHVDIAAEARAARQLDLGVADLAADPAGRQHRQQAGHRELALEGAADLAVFDGGVAFEQARLAAFQAVAVAQVGLDLALHHPLLTDIGSASCRERVVSTV